MASRAGGGNTNDTYRYATLNGVKVALPTYGAELDSNGMTPVAAFDKNGTAVSNTTTVNPTYNDLFAIWDAHNGAGTSSLVSGVPSGWRGDGYWSATSSAAGAEYHVFVKLIDGNTSFNYDFGGYYVALQVL